ncbi:MAG: methylmalonyl Co-A mutase-associated GTPase MeaB [Myxococcota bacterium]
MSRESRPTRRKNLSVADYVEGVLDGDRMILARAITLIESNRRDHRRMAQEVLTQLLPHTGGAHRVGITGVPGVGKSTFIEELGVQLLEDQARTIAVLAIDPTSSVRGGSILGDKTRMSRLSQDARAFIRPSPTQGSLGGVHRKTRETMIVCEAFGVDVVIVETVGVGQSETMVADMVDTYLVLMLPGAGDELQGIKKGILEVADIMAVNKADGDNVKRAHKARGEYKRALHLMGQRDPEGDVPVLTCSGLHGDGVAAVWETVARHKSERGASGAFEARRRAQRRTWMWTMVEQELLAQFREHDAVAALAPALEWQVREGECTPTTAAERLLAAFGLEV